MAGIPLGFPFPPLALRRALGRGALAEPETRLWWWLAAALIDLAGAWSAHRLLGWRFRTAEIPFAPAHMIERSRLFLIIALGETILTTGVALASAELDTATIVSALLAVLGNVALWGLYFGGAGRLVTEHATRTGDLGPSRSRRCLIRRSLPDGNPAR